MSKPLVYLAGPIAGCTGPEAFDWRLVAEKLLDDRGIEALTPMRAKSGLLCEKSISRDFHDYQDRGVFYTPYGIMTRDHTDVLRSDALLVYFVGAETVSAGTAMELAWAFDRHKPVVVAIEEGNENPHARHPMISVAMPFRVPTLEEAVDAVAVVLNR